ncbi:MAG TPA: hypothetical protein VGA64_05715 [Candidatus Polarisedimenticolia bacterium]
MPDPGGDVRTLTQEIYLQDLVLSIYRVYAGRMCDPGARSILELYLTSEAERGRRIADVLLRLGAKPSPGLRVLFSKAGRGYGIATSFLGTRLMQRIILSASRRASRHACAALGADPRPDLIYLASLRARNEGDLRDAMMQHLIDTRPKKA